jgi:hypothetical protein
MMRFADSGVPAKELPAAGRRGPALAGAAAKPARWQAARRVDTVQAQ